jgi:hypothetical protein
MQDIEDKTIADRRFISPDEVQLGLRLMLGARSKTNFSPLAARWAGR